MPRRDGSGPKGSGAMTGRGLGLCSGANALKYEAEAGIGMGLGLACRRGFGRGYGRGFARGFRVDSTSSKTQREELHEKRIILQERLEAIDKQLESL